MSTADAFDVVQDVEGKGHTVPREVRTSEIVFPKSKRVLDIIVASTLLVLAGPLFVVVAIIVRRDGGPVFFSQRRLGEGGCTIQIRKFRSMAVDAEERLHADPRLYARYVENGFKLPEDEDPRLTRCGRFLRSTSLDEMPQLLNVLRADLSMVGPRPIVGPELVNYASRGAADSYLSARPGLTGLWQVSGRSTLSYDDRVDLDQQYLARQSLLGDIKIILKTAVVVLRRVGAH